MGEKAPTSCRDALKAMPAFKAKSDKLKLGEQASASCRDALKAIPYPGLVGWGRARQNSSLRKGSSLRCPVPTLQPTLYWPYGWQTPKT